MAFLWQRMAFAILIAISQLNSQAEVIPSKEYKLKAAFLFNFAGFAEWPTTMPSRKRTRPLVIGVLGEDPFDGYLDQTVRGEKVNGRPLIVQRFQSVDAVQNCHILFISQSEANRLGSIITPISRGRHILTVSDVGDFAQRGGMIQLTTENNKIRLKINLESAKAARLLLSSKLLRPAEIVNGKS